MMASEDENNIEEYLNARIKDLEEQLEKSEEGAEEARRAAAEERKRLNDVTAEKKIEEARNRLTSEERIAAEKRAEKAEQELVKANTDLTRANERIANADAELTDVSKKLTDTTGELTATNARLADVEDVLSDAKKDLSERGRFEKLAKEEFEARTELREFVASSLADIMLGVDEAALSAVSRHLQSGLLEEPMISPSRVGQVVGGSETLVHFDLAVVASTQSIDGKIKGKGGGVGISVRGKFWDQIGVSGTADFKMRSESVSEERRGVTQDQRIRFSVPLIFASQDELVG